MTESSSENLRLIVGFKILIFKLYFQAYIFLAFCSQCLTDPKILESEKWLTQLYQELENQGLSLPERYFTVPVHSRYWINRMWYFQIVPFQKSIIMWHSNLLDIHAVKSFCSIVDDVNLPFFSVSRNEKQHINNLLTTVFLSLIMELDLLRFWVKFEFIASPSIQLLM